MRLKLFNSVVVFATAMLIMPSTHACEEKNKNGLMSECRALVTGYQIIHGEAPQLYACREAVNKEIGGSDAHFYFGRVLYQHGYIEEAIAEFRKARSGGSSKGALALGYMIERGVLSPREAARSEMEFYQEAMGQNDPVAKIVKAIKLSYTLDPPGRRDMQRAKELFSEAEAQNHPAANFYLAELLRFPDGQLKSDLELAVLHYRKAAEGGVADAIEALEEMSEDTSMYEGVPIVYSSVVEGPLIIERP
ncbi:tetratricopeptide repeat protein [Marinobacter sp.]|uniref:tetratricopeptide repeat protein n=1 Tax=Marinobacter sp. TaxID=50741 RepID=UPI00384BD34B